MPYFSFSKIAPMKYLFIFLALFLCVKNHAQRNDNTWLFNQWMSNSLKFDFRQEPPNIDIIAINMQIAETNSSFSDNIGNLLFYTNGETINNWNLELVEAGDSLNIGYWADAAGGYRIINGAFFLPCPADSNQVYLIYMFMDHFSGGVNPLTKVQYAKIDIAANNGQGKVLAKRMPILTANTDIGFRHAGAVRHANGRDWWILVPSHKEAKYYRILLTPDGFSEPEEQEIGFREPITLFYTNRNLFSQDGSKYADYDQLNGVQFFDFDRCTGLLSNPVKIDYMPSPMDINYQSGVAFSPSGRLAYVMYALNNYFELRQYNLDAADIAASEQLLSSCSEFDGQLECSMWNIMLAPDDNIYIGAYIDSFGMHIIREPDSLGISCGFEFGGFDLPVGNTRFNMPYFPNYRLYDVPGSACDTLGIDAPPPPPSATVEEQGGKGGKLVISPNPAGQDCSITYQLEKRRNGTISVWDSYGRQVAEYQLEAASGTVQLSGLASGVYFISLSVAGQIVQTEKLVRF
jgi:Secretion system C-terminal sorting domain